MNSQLSKAFDFIHSQKVASITAFKNGELFPFNCFYCFLPSEQRLIFKTNASSAHYMPVMSNDGVCGTIYQFGESPFFTEGIQFHGVVEKAGFKQMAQYQFRFPLSLAVPGEHLVLRFTKIKHTWMRNGVKEDSTHVFEN